MLECQYRGRYENRHLLIVGYSLECSSNSHFCFPESYIPANQSVHRSRTFHVGFDLSRSTYLVRCIFVDETCLQLLLHEAIGAKRETLLAFTFGIEDNQIPGYIFDLLFGPFLHFLPGSGTQFAQFRRFTIVLSFIFGQFMQGMNANKYRIIILIDKLDDLLHFTVHLHTHQSSELTYTMVYMHNIITWCELV